MARGGEPGAARCFWCGLEADDEAAGDGFGVGSDGGVVDAVAEVGDAPVDVRKDGGVDTEDVAIGEVVRVLDSS